MTWTNEVEIKRPCNYEKFQENNCIGNYGNNEIAPSVSSSCSLFEITENGFPKPRHCTMPNAITVFPLAKSA